MAARARTPRTRRADTRPATRVTPRRAGAAVVDMLLIAASFVAFAAAARGIDHGDGNDFRVHLDGAPAVLWAVLAFAYFVATEAIAGQTLGKLIFGLRVVRLDGRAPGVGAILVRNALRLIDGLPLFYALGFIVVLASPLRQRIGDLAAGTVVVAI